MKNKLKILNKNPINNVLLLINNPAMIITEKIYKKFFDKNNYIEVIKNLGDDKVPNIYFKEGKNIYKIFFEDEESRLLSDFAFLLYHLENALFILFNKNLKYIVYKHSYEKVFDLNGFIFWEFVSKEMSFKVGYTKNVNLFIAIKMGG